MKNIKLTLAYDGTNYHGYQLQSNAITVQEKLENALNYVYHPHKITPYSASRTDSGVHAEGHVVNFFAPKDISISKIPLAINTNLPNDIAVIDAELVGEDFHARRDAVKKEYHYYAYYAHYMDPFWRNYAIHLRDNKLDLAEIKETGKQFIGKHDFTAFRSIQGGDPSIDPVKEIYTFDIEYQKDKLIVFKITGNAFLYKMVRIMVGTLLEIGRGKITPNTIRTALDTGDRDLVGPTADPHGLVLHRIWYP